MTNTLHSDTSQFLSWVLRHEPHAIGLSLNSEGWADMELLLAAAAKHGRALDRALVEKVVATSSKKRFALSADGTLIRAVQGHSTASVSISFEAKTPRCVVPRHGVSVPGFHSRPRLVATLTAIRASVQGCVHGHQCRAAVRHACRTAHRCLSNA